MPHTPSGGGSITAPDIALALAEYVDKGLAVERHRQSAADIGVVFSISLRQRAPTHSREGPRVRILSPRQRGYRHVLDNDRRIAVPPMEIGTPGFDPLASITRLSLHLFGSSKNLTNTIARYAVYCRGQTSKVWHVVSRAFLKMFNIHLIEVTSGRKALSPDNGND
jgi:hypothetical protein